MIEKAKDKVLEVSTPYEAETMDNYLKYLYVLKGRQNKNYVDYLNTAVDDHNNQVATIDTEYTNMVNTFNNEMQIKGAMASEDYARWQTVLTDMYNKLDGATASQLDTQYKQAQIEKIYADMSIDAIKAQQDSTKNKSWL